ncbi:SDR family NAD(P)-dependent oxidoreductase [Niallia endozanthoxylica]|uniref:SDR family oxidoreductase n=1 Tax=Niallia endozanthoxylica TaxID=2036016 RepID=A0A5J5HW66_9BACI|nr:SDR family oxidoreductase [Niallia endozanthoxylica]KAA9027033.1 SDR family oxidoreductase [Niallia endozanthoxylica]
MSILTNHPSFTGQVVIVTGSSRGIGKTIASSFAREGAKVLITGTEEERTKQAAAEIAEQSAGEIDYFVGDLSLEESVTAMVEKTVTKWRKIDILVNNAGGGVIRPFLEQTPETLKTTIDRNLWTCLWSCYKVLPYMVEQKFGRVINIGADSVRNGLWEHAAYNAAKGGMHALTTGLAREFAQYDITVNTVAPPAVESGALELYKQKQPETAKKMIDIIPKGRGAYEEEIADSVLFLASEKTTFITGQVISVNGGSTML